ncbi:serine/threonine-protein kinase [Nocardiopsis metallicus]|uniref:non-specific serine/threonine protein kinase n=1 Tax=Nocardiopsis metallicus TaxID=179819 RepID=A0A840WDX9_9ACTN|nr:serine/threonine-protein kinase [Nocardiopsis metallicus]MBB5495189.1 putative Ser/Thr protein kinase [Nocardiopsis metallicus]
MSSNSQQTIANRYVLRRELGRGGMGIVWEAHDTALDRVVAVKQVILPGHFTDAERDDAHARVRREAQSAARIAHPTVITIHDVFEYEHNPWVVMELVEGGSLQEMLAETGALPPDTVADIAESLLQAVRAADAAGVLHRDIKPGNIMMSSDGRVILTDFGIATMEGGPSITRTGALIGSPEYMPPERLEGGPAEHRGDLWSIGVTLYAAVEGTSPFRRDSITAAIAAVISAPLPPMTRAGWLEPVITGLLERDPDRRLTVDEALDLLRRCRGGDLPGAAAAGGFGGTGAQESHSAHSGGYPGQQASGQQTPYPGEYSSGGGYYGQGAYPGGDQYGHEQGHYAHAAAPYPQYDEGGYGGGHQSTAHAAGGPAPDRRGGSGKTWVALGVTLVAVLVVAGIVVAVSMRPDAGSDTAADDPGRSEGRDSEAAQEEAEGVRVEGTPPEYDDDDLQVFGSEWFTISYPGGWTVDDSQIDDSIALFVAPGMEHELMVEGWEESDFTGTAGEFLAQTDGGTDIEDATSGYEVLDSEDFDRDDFDGGLAGLDVAMVEADLVNTNWGDPERRLWVYAVVLEEGDQRVFYLVSVNVPREQEGDFDDIHEDVIETFTPHK